MQLDVVAGQRVTSFYVDALPVSRADWSRFCAATGRACLDVPASALHDAVVNVGPDDAAACAAWLGMRLPTLWEWQRFARGRFGLTPAPEHEPFEIEDLCVRWEWTSSPAPLGFWVCGGVDRQQPRAPTSVDNVAYEDAAAGDVGFRCVRDPTSDDVDKTTTSARLETTERVLRPTTTTPPAPPRPPLLPPVDHQEWVRIGDVVCRWASVEPRALRVHAGGRATPAFVERRWYALDAQLAVACTALNLPAALPTFQAHGVDDQFLQARDEVPGTTLSTLFTSMREQDGGRLPVDVACGLARRLGEMERPLPLRAGVAGAMRMGWDGQLFVATDGLVRAPYNGIVHGQIWSLTQEAVLGAVERPTCRAFHVAALLFHVLAPQWRFDSLIGHLQALVQNTRPPLRSLNGDVDEELAALVDAALRPAAQRPEGDELIEAVSARAVDAPEFLAGLARGLLGPERDDDLAYWDEAELVDVGGLRSLAMGPALAAMTMDDAIREIERIAAMRT